MSNDPSSSLPPPSEPPPAPPPTPPQQVEPPPAPPPVPPPPSASSSDAASLANEKNLAMFCHLSALVGGLLLGWTGLPLGNILGPLIIWLLKKDSMPLVNEHGKEALNFQITTSIAITACLLTFFLLITIPLAIGIGIGALVFTIIGTIKASNGQLYRYPFNLRLIK